MIVSGTDTGTLKGIPPTGKGFSVDYVHWFRLADGKVAEMWAVRDDLSRLQQLGLTPVRLTGEVQEGSP
jgi:predicted ester cyclase